MIRKPQMFFDAYSQAAGAIEERFVGEELLEKEGPIKVVTSLFCKLPFRLRLGERSVFEVGGIVPSQITVFNSIAIPDIKIAKKLLGDPPHDYVSI